MMNIIEVPMHRKNGTTVQLIDFLGAIPTNNWVWTIMEFDGVGEMPNQMSVAECAKQPARPSCRTRRKCAFGSHLRCQK
jgi:hypothetical protein